MTTRVSSGFAWLEDDTTGDPVGLRRPLDGKEFTLATLSADAATDGESLNGKVVVMGDTPDETNTEDYPVGTLFISPAE